MLHTIAEVVTGKNKCIRVTKTANDVYQVIEVDHGILTNRHPESKAEDVMRALAQYMQGMAYQISKVNPIDYEGE